jgi:pimeloyl-ACP methyl ester carboxylesterase
MLLDESCGIYISRPCSFGLARLDPSCDPAVWTVDRYSRETVESILSAIESEVAEERSIVLVGFSGGGLLASHVAQRLDRAEALVTLGANLDLEAWVGYHGYTREILSRTPASPFPLRTDLVQLHVVGERDAVAPPAMSLALLGVYQADGELAEVLILPDVDHTCCWLREWPGIRETLQQWIERSTRI